jgi:uncharacterized CHY-type Zn-finger protein
MPAINRLQVSAALLVVAFAVCVVPATAQVTADRTVALSDYHGYYPCMDCHGDQESVATPRILEEEHYEPMEWEDDDGVIHYVPFGQKLAIADLLSPDGAELTQADKLARIGRRLNIENYLSRNGLSPADSVWTLVHGGGNLWCFDCHDAEDRDKLVMQSGELLSFNDSQYLCGSCHGPILRDWTAGIHGKTVGFWDPQAGEEEETVRMLCVECHDSHRPAFRLAKPMAAPVLRIDGPGAKSSHLDKSSQMEKAAHIEESTH